MEWLTIIIVPISLVLSLWCLVLLFAYRSRQTGRKLALGLAMALFVGGLYFEGLMSPSPVKPDWTFVLGILITICGFAIVAGAPSGVTDWRCLTLNFARSCGCQADACSRARRTLRTS